MKYWLMFWLNSQGLAREAKVECFNHQRVARIEDAQVSKVSVNEKDDHDLVDSLKTAGNAALRLLARNHRDFRACRVVGNYEDPHTPVSGESAGLLFALATYIELLVLKRNHKPFPDPVFAATGSIDEHGVVRKVLDVPAKIRAALDVLPAKSFVFYPKMNFGEVDETLIRLADSRDINLRPVESIGEALKFLEIIVEDWPESRSPYPGLNSFGASQSQIFFGRAAETDALIKTLKQRAENGRPGAMVIASSGTGKSSFVAAGVIATLRFDDRQKELEYAIWQPSNAKGNQVGHCHPYTSAMVYLPHCKIWR